MLPSRTERWRGPIRWFSAAALFAAAPKCLVCLAAYAGVGAALGLKLGGPEICGASASPVAGSLAWLALATVVAGIFIIRRHRA
jgi:MYXO-CTERM domain-containing protein